MKIPQLRLIAILACCLAHAGCCFDPCKLEFCDDGCYDDALVQRYGEAGLRAEEPCLDDCAVDHWVEPISPRDLGNENVRYSEAFQEVDYNPIALEDCIRMALQSSDVMRDLGGTILRNPNGQMTVYDPALAYADPRIGEEAALSAFDANLFASAFFDYNDRAFNNGFFGNNGLLVQELGDYRWGLSKQAATGSLFTFRHITNRENSNQLGNAFGTPSSAYDTYLEAEARQPLLQGAGVLFNRINGDSQEVGVYNGILIARANTDISLAQFEQGVRDLVSNVENAYWDLYFAYRDLDAKIDARDSALDTWRGVRNKLELGVEGGTDDQEGQAREQFFRFEAEVIDALYGRLVDGTRTNNGSSSGTFRSAGGVRVAERRLRLIMGMQLNDGRLLRPQDEPGVAPIRFDWQTSTNEAIANRPELRQTRWRVKQRELELIASKNHLMPRLDAVGRYRFRGFGSDLFSNSGQFVPTPTPGANRSGAFNDLVSFDRQEWQVGVEFSMPIGFRREHSAVRNAELNLTREKAIMREQEREIMYGLSNAVDELHRAYESMRAQYNRYESATFQAAAVAESFDAGKTTLDVVLEAQRRVVDAEIRFYQAEVEYALAIKNVHFEKGTLLEFTNVQLAESLSPAKAYRDASNRDCLRGENLDYVCRDIIVSSGPRGSNLQSHDVMESDEETMVPTYHTPTPAYGGQQRHQGVPALPASTVPSDGGFGSYFIDEGANQPFVPTIESASSQIQETSYADSSVIQNQNRPLQPSQVYLFPDSQPNTQSVRPAGHGPGTIMSISDDR